MTMKLTMEPSLRTVLALALIRRQWRMEDPRTRKLREVEQELAYMRHRVCELPAPSVGIKSLNASRFSTPALTSLLLTSTCALPHGTQITPTTALPWEAAELVAWLEHKDGDPKDIIRTGLSLLDACLQVPDIGCRSCLGVAGGEAAASELLGRVLHAEKALRQHNSTSSAHFAQRLCKSCIHSGASRGMAWLNIVQRLLMHMAVEPGTHVLRILASTILELVVTVQETPKLEPRCVLGAQPVLGAMQQALELASSTATAMSAPDTINVSNGAEWQQLLQQAFERSLCLKHCPLLAHCVWHMALISGSSCMSAVSPLRGGGSLAVVGDGNCEIASQRL